MGAVHAHSRTLTAEIVRTIVDEAAARGFPAGDVLSRFDVPEDVLRDVDGRVPAQVAVRLWMGVPRLVDDDCFGLRLGEKTAAKSFALVSHLFEACDSVGDGIERLVALQRVMNDVHTTELTRSADVASLRVRTVDSPLPVPSHAIDFAFAWMAVVSRRATGRDLPATRVLFEHEAPVDAREYRRVFGCPVEFGADHNELAFPEALLALPLRRSDPGLRAVLESHARILIDRLPTSATFAARVSEAVVPLLPAGPTIERVARAMRVSPRSLQRYLHAEGASFEKVLEDVRKSRAQAALRDPRRSIAEVSAALGFADQSAFHRAFVRWMGTTPGAYKRASR